MNIRYTKRSTLKAKLLLRSWLEPNWAWQMELAHIHAFCRCVMRTEWPLHRGGRVAANSPCVHAKGPNTSTSQGHVNTADSNACFSLRGSWHGEGCCTSGPSLPWCDVTRFEFHKHGMAAMSSALLIRFWLQYYAYRTGLCWNRYVRFLTHGHII